MTLTEMLFRFHNLIVEFLIRGHKIAKSKGGSNTDVVLQKKRDNRQWQDDYEHNQ